MENTGMPTPPALTYFATLDVAVDPPIDLGRTVDGVRRVVPIRGGAARGEGWEGVVLDAGADFQHYPAGDTAYLAADYVVEASDGTRILVENRALRSADPEDLRRMMSGETVDPDRVYFRCVPRLTSDEDGPFGWVNRRLFIGTGVRRPDGVRIEVFLVG